VQPAAQRTHNPIKMVTGSGLRGPTINPPPEHSLREKPKVCAVEMLCELAKSAEVQSAVGITRFLSSFFSLNRALWFGPYGQGASARRPALITAERSPTVFLKWEIGLRAQVA